VDRTVRVRDESAQGDKCSNIFNIYTIRGELLI
jgi:hypothetical protein